MATFISWVLNRKCEAGNSTNDQLRKQEFLSFLLIIFLFKYLHILSLIYCKLYANSKGETLDKISYICVFRPVFICQVKCKPEPLFIWTVSIWTYLYEQLKSWALDCTAPQCSFKPPPAKSWRILEICSVLLKLYTIPLCYLRQLSGSQISAWESQDVFSCILFGTIVHRCSVPQRNTLSMLVLPSKNCPTGAHRAQLRCLCRCWRVTNMFVVLAVIWLLNVFFYFIVTEIVVCSCDTEKTDTTELLFCVGLGQAAQADGPFRIQSQNSGIFLISLKCGWQDKHSAVMDLPWTMKSRRALPAHGVAFHDFKAKSSLR